GQHPCDGSVMHMQLAGDGTGAPLLNVVVAQDLRLELGGYGHGSAPRRRRKKPVRRNGEQGRPHKWQRHADDCWANARGTRRTTRGATAAPGLITSSMVGGGEP